MAETSAARRIIPDDGDRLMTLDEAAARLRSSRLNIGRLIKNRALIPVEIGQHKFIRKYTLNNFLAKLEGHTLQEFLDRPCIG